MATEQEMTELRETIDSTKESLDKILEELKRLDRSKAGKVSTTILGVLVGAMLLLSVYVWDNAKDSREALANNLETVLVTGCNNNQEDRVRLRGVFQLLLSQAASQSSNPEESAQFIDEFNDRLLEAVPDRDCAEESRARRS